MIDLGLLDPGALNAREAMAPKSGLTGMKVKEETCEA